MTQSYTMRCGVCGTKNRVPADKVERPARCGRCKGNFDTSPLSVGTPVTVTDGSFEQAVLAAPLPVLLDCFAAWCGPCRMLEPVLAELAGLWRGRVRVAKLDVEKNRMIAGRYQVRSTPTLMIFENGRLRDSVAGALPKAQIMERVRPWIYS